ncbi:MAG TPA: 30S ribosomal protein S4 [Candidatus Onthovivens sp.]|nr:30S ribosomal protein S4 [Candidatus Onthovivens sp.]
MRNLDSRWKRSRRLGFSLSETGVELKKRAYAPGQHGQDRKKQSEYGKQLTEKQKLRDLYRVNERQFRRLFMIARNTAGIAGVNFMVLLESRLDNLTYRLGFATSRGQSRQLVNHGHVLVNGKKIDIPSYTCKVGDVISIKENSRNLVIIKNSLESAPATAPYLEINKTALSGTFTRLPERSELSQEINEASIVEYYNRLI